MKEQIKQTDLRIRDLTYFIETQLRVCFPLLCTIETLKKFALEQVKIGNDSWSLIMKFVGKEYFQAEKNFESISEFQKELKRLKMRRIAENNACMRNWREVIFHDVFVIMSMFFRT